MGLHGCPLHGVHVRGRVLWMMRTQVLGTDTWLEGGLSGTQRTGGLTEAQLTDVLGPDQQAFPIPRSASATISWWQLRQQAFNRALAVRTELPTLNLKAS